MKEIFLDLVTRLSSRKFILVFALLLVLAADNSGLILDPEIRKSMMTLIIAYLAAEGTKDAILAYKE